MNDDKNRPLLVFSLGIYSLLMGLMAIASYGHAASGAFGLLMAFLVWPLLFCSVVSGMAWLAGAPFLRGLYEDERIALQLLAAFIFLSGITVLAFAAIAAWLCESTLSYAGWSLLSGIIAAHQQASIANCLHETGPIPLPAVRLV